MSVSITTIDGVRTATFIGTGALSSVTNLLDGATTAIIMNYTSIDNYAFYGATGLVSITIAGTSSLTSIGNGAFYGATGLVSISVDTHNTNYSSIDGVLFTKNQQTIIQFPIDNDSSSYTIPASVISIGNGAFYGATSLISIVIPASVGSIGSYAFYGATGLTSITFMYTSSLTRIGSYAFYGTTGLTSITIPAGVTSIGYGAALNIAYVSIPNGLNILDTILHTRIPFYGKSDVLILKYIPFTNVNKRMRTLFGNTYK